MKIKELVRQVLPPLLIKPAGKIYGMLIKNKKQKVLYQRLCRLIQNNLEISRLFPESAFRQHYVYEPSRQTIEHPDIFINQIRYYRLYEFFLKNYPQFFDNKSAIADVGDTSGNLFRALRCRGLSVNINPEVVKYIRQGGIEAELGDIEKLPFENGAFEYTFCFQCLEHTLNPIQALRELSRVTRKKIFLSIPYVEKTVIYSLDYWKNLKSKDIKHGGWSVSSPKGVDCHKFEFSTEDFKKLLSHACLKYCGNFPINYFKPLGSTSKNEGSYFNFFILEPFPREV